MTAKEKVSHQPTGRRSTQLLKRSARICLARWRAILLAVLVISTAGYAVVYYFAVYRPDQQTDRVVTRQVIRAASEGAVALLSYSPETLSRDLDNAKSRITEDYLTYYQQFADQIVGPSTQRAQITTSATVVKAAVAELHANSAVVLLFVRQKTASKEKPEPVVTSNSLRVTLKKVNSSWLIEKFEGV
ncbi:twin-arginine translocation pathway signal [Mycobacterium vicinigordonae]|uniref:Twin-arginine translocation pathway signal n=1 Tax=Mycobacterium vicinigordonae TaxID=1719132 RepID=A0A7D6HZZ6_9MYCO|nr:twin-arginine translocation pathway signal [Mycobacterium vicinigordonae]QLL06754.1 twin-arginine translocation pathway signal [Mycobacterium vicinigordonae]